MANIIGETRPYNEQGGFPVYDAPGTRQYNEKVFGNTVYDFYVTRTNTTITISTFSGHVGGAGIQSGTDINIIVDPDVNPRDVYVVAKTDESNQVTTIEKIETAVGVDPVLADDYSTIRETLMVSFKGVDPVPNLESINPIIYLTRRWTARDEVSKINLDLEIGESINFEEFVDEHPYALGYRHVQVRLDGVVPVLTATITDAGPFFLFKQYYAESGGQNVMNSFAYTLTYSAGGNVGLLEAVYFIIRTGGNTTAPPRPKITQVKFYKSNQT